jgi:hypothetical protein
MSPDMSSEAIAHRLEALRELHRLGLSLARSRGPSIPDNVFYNRSLGIAGVVSAARLQAVAAGLAPGTPQANELCLLTAFAGANHPVGQEFDVLVDASRRVVLAQARAILVGVTQQFGRPMDEAPAGWRCICVVRFPAGIPDAARAIQFADQWDGPIQAWVAREADYRRLAGGDA